MLRECRFVYIAGGEQTFHTPNISLDRSVNTTRPFVQTKDNAE